MVQCDSTLLSTAVNEDSKHNFTRFEKVALKLLRCNQDLIIRNADKVGSVVLLDAGLYSKQNKSILSDSVTYSRLQVDATEQFKSDLKSILDDF